MTPASQEISSGLVRPIRGVDEYGPLVLRSVGSKSTGIRLIKEPVENSDDSEFDDFKV